MKLPKNFKKTIEKTFYDKEIDIYDSSPVKEADGWTRKGNLTKVGTFFGNVNFSNLQKVQEDYGIREDIDAAITTSANIQAETVIGYKGKLFKVLTSKPFDSHNLLIAQEWSSKLSTSTSA